MSSRLHGTFLLNLRERLVETGTTQRELAEAMGVTEGYVSQILSGRHVPRIDLLERLGKVLHCEPHELLAPAGQKISA